MWNKSRYATSCLLYVCRQHLGGGNGRGSIRLPNLDEEQEIWLGSVLNAKWTDECWWQRGVCSLQGCVWLLEVCQRRRGVCCLQDCVCLLASVLVTKRSVLSAKQCVSTWKWSQWVSEVLKITRFFLLYLGVTERSRVMRYEVFSKIMQLLLILPSGT